MDPVIVVPLVGTTLDNCPTMPPGPIRIDSLTTAVYSTLEVLTQDKRLGITKNGSFSKSSNFGVVPSTGQASDSSLFSLRVKSWFSNTCHVPSIIWFDTGSLPLNSRDCASSSKLNSFKAFSLPVPFVRRSFLKITGCEVSSRLKGLAFTCLIRADRILRTPDIADAWGNIIFVRGTGKKRTTVWSKGKCL